MVIEKSDSFSYFWTSCDELCGCMNASRYSDRVAFVPHTGDSRGNSSWKKQ